ncbi:hypothetical protein ABBQ32_000323 [Trebouxia sp. C0010 RCD-2024]
MPGEPRSFCNTWINHLVLNLPTLAVAIDDSLMALVERCVKHLAAEGAASPVRAQPQSPAMTADQVGRADPWSPGAGPSWSPAAISPMTLLEQARQAKQLNQALDSFGGSRHTASGGWNQTTSPNRPGGTSLVNMAMASAAAMRSPPSSLPSPSTPSHARPPLAPGTHHPSPGPSPDTPSPSGASTLSWAESQMSAELLAQSISAAAPRLLLQNFSMAKVKLLIDLHVTDAGPNIPFGLDTHRAPLTIAGVGSSRLLYRPSVMLHGLLAHALAEAMLSAPGMLGSLDLLFNPTGLLQSLGQAWGTLLLGPLAAIEARSPSQFLVGVGAGGATLVREISAWTLGSIGGFSYASSKLLARALRSQPAAREGGHGVSALGRGVQGLLGGVTAGVTGVVRAPLQGYNDGSGVVTGVGRGLLGVVGLPLSGALGLVGAVTSGLASSTGLTPAHAIRRPGRTQDSRPAPSPSYLERLLSQLQRYGKFIAHCQPKSVQLSCNTPARPDSTQPQTVQEPVLVLTTSHILVLEHLHQPKCAITLQGVLNVTV